MKKLLIVISLIFFSLSSSAQLSILERNKNAEKIDFRTEKQKDRNRLFESVLVGYGALFVVANFSEANTNKFIIPAFIFTGIGLTTLIKERKRKSDQCKNVIGLFR